MDRQPSVIIVVATHKKYRMPTDQMYLPLQVGAEISKDNNGHSVNLGYTKDNTGENISDLNASFCELTGLFWAWKNLKADYIGLVHYRRYFGYKKTKDPFDGILTYKQLKPYLGDVKVFVPKKRRYYIETLYSHYAHTHYAEQLDKVREIIKEKYPEYLNSYDKVVKQTYGYMFNMMIMKQDFLNKYCSWLFPILFELQDKVPSKNLSDFQGRFYGRVSEILLNVWLRYQLDNRVIQRNEIKEIPYIYMEKVNWFKKGTAFIEAKLFNKKYEKSF